MSLLKDFDLAIANIENSPTGFITDKGNYSSYMSNASWVSYLEEMSEEHRAQFGNGSGGELKEKNGRPPKMASFASSSRMIYQLSKDISGFVFEKQLSTVIGGVANLDGYRECNGQYIFVEAKCREPYSHKSPQTIKQNYRSLYTYLQGKLPDMFTCTMEDIHDTRDMQVKFFCFDKEVVYFDMKQMLCHLLGIANKMLLNNTCNTTMQFLYLLYNPSKLVLPPASKAEISRIYKDTCTAAESYDFRQIFGYVVDFLIEQKKYPVSEEDTKQLKKHFHFELCDQYSYTNFFV